MLHIYTTKIRKHSWNSSKYVNKKKKNEHLTIYIYMILPIQNEILTLNQ